MEHPGVYRYQQLSHQDSIRIIELKPATDYEAEIECEIVHCRLQEHPDYEAISYVWHDPVFSETLKSPEGCFKITSSLSVALRRFRLKDDVRRVWADAVCIHQTDNIEKGLQVALMHEIYKAATRVLAWLGEASEDTCQAFLNCQRLAASAARFHIEDKDVDYEVFVGPQLKKPDASGELKPLSGYTLTVPEIEEVRGILEDFKNSKLDRLVELSWFSRMWIIQEVAHSSRTTLFCGEEEMEWSVFAPVMSLLSAILGLGGHSALLGPYAREIMTMDMTRAWNIVYLRNEFHVTSSPGIYVESKYRGFGRNLKRTRFHNCTDERDRIYGLLSLSPKFRGIEIQPDYNISEPVLFRDVARQFLPVGSDLVTGDIRVLDDAGLWCRSYTTSTNLEAGDMSSPDYLPSWAPEYRPSKLNDDELPWNNGPFKMSHPNMPQTIHDSDPDKNVLGLTASVVDIVAYQMVVVDKEIAADLESGAALPTGLTTMRSKCAIEDAQNIIKMIRSFTQTVLSDGKYITGEDGRAALLRTLFADHSHRQLLKILFHTPDVKNESDMIILWETFEKSFLDDDGEASLFFKRMRAASSPPSSVPRTVQDVFEVFQAIQFVLSRCQFIVSETGYFGLVPKVTRRHDAIVRIQGTKTPFVVRSVGTEGRCVLVGPCYVHGFMYGDIPYDYNKSGVMYLV